MKQRCAGSWLYSPGMFGSTSAMYVCVTDIRSICVRGCMHACVLTHALLPIITIAIARAFLELPERAHPTRRLQGSLNDVSSNDNVRYTYASTSDRSARLQILKDHIELYRAAACHDAHQSGSSQMTTSQCTSCVDRNAVFKVWSYALSICRGEPFAHATLTGASC